MLPESYGKNALEKMHETEQNNFCILTKAENLYTYDVPTTKSVMTLTHLN